MAPWCRDKFLLQYILRIGDATLIVWTNPQNVLLQNLVHVNIPKPGIWIFSYFSFYSFYEIASIYQRSFWDFPDWGQENGWVCILHPQNVEKKTSQPVDSSASPCSSRRSSAWVEPVEPVRNPVKTGDIPRSTCEKKETSWDIHIRCGLMKVWWGLHTRPTNHQWDLILHCFRLIFRYILGTRARQDFQAGEKGRSKTAWNADSKQKWGCQLPPTHLNCELAGKMVWSGGMNRAETAQVGQFGLSCQWILVRICV